MLVVAACAAPGWLWQTEFGGYDAMAYHLQLPREWFEQGRITTSTWNVYSAMPNYRDMMRHAIYEHLGVEPEVRVICDGLLPTLRLLELGDFLAVMPHAAINRDLTPNLRAVPAGLTPRRNQAAFFYRSEMDDWEIVQAIRRLCLQRFGPLESQKP